MQIPKNLDENLKGIFGAIFKIRYIKIQKVIMKKAAFSLFFLVILNVSAQQPRPAGVRCIASTILTLNNEVRSA